MRLLDEIGRASRGGIKRYKPVIHPLDNRLAPHGFGYGLICWELNPDLPDDARMVNSLAADLPGCNVRNNVIEHRQAEVHAVLNDILERRLKLPAVEHAQATELTLAD